MYKYIIEFFKKIDYSQFPDIKPLGVTKKTYKSENRDFNEDMYDLFSKVRVMPITREEFLKK
jgi:hypothetical protein